MAFESEIGRLTEDLLRAFDGRIKAVADSRSNTVDQLRADQSNRRAMSAEQQKQFRQHLDQLQQNFAKFRSDAQHQMNQLQAAQVSMATAQHQHLAQQACQLQQQTTDFINQTHAARMTMSANQHNYLSEHLQQVRHDSDTFLANRDAARRQATADKQHELATYMAGLQSDVNQLCTDTAAFVERVNNERAAMMAAQREQLTNAKDQLTSGVQAMRSDLQAAQEAMRRDHAAAKQGWRQMKQTLAQKRSGQPVEPATVEPVAPAPAAVEPIAPAPVEMAPTPVVTDTVQPVVVDSMLEQQEDEKKKG